MAGQGDVYGHSAGASIVCLTPSGLPTRSHGAGFIALCPWEQWPLKVPWCLSACPDPGGHPLGTSQREGDYGGLTLELYPQRKASWLVSTSFLSLLPTGQPVTPPALCQAQDPSPLSPGWEGHSVGQQPSPFVLRPASEFCLSHSRYISCLLWGKQKQKIFCHQSHPFWWQGSGQGWQGALPTRSWTCWAWYLGGLGQGPVGRGISPSGGEW